jgi:hypothetical protein
VLRASQAAPPTVTPPRATPYRTAEPPAHRKPISFEEANNLCVKFHQYAGKLVVPGINTRNPTRDI